MTKAEINIISRIVEAQIRVYQWQLRLDKAVEEENEAEYDRLAEKKMAAQRKVADYRRQFFDGFITAKDIMDSCDDINAALDMLAKETAYPMEEGTGVREFFGDMIIAAKSRGELD